MSDSLELFQFTDSSWVIMDAHLPFNEAIKIVEKEDPELVKEFHGVNHWWVRYEFAEEEDREDYGVTSWWVIHETTKRPKGITKRATVMIV